MITKITGETPFQVLTNNFSISPSNEGYTLQISADGRQFSNLFTVGAGVTRLVTGVAANSYYRLSGNQSAVSINWMKTCVTEGGGSGSGTELTPVTEFPVGAEAGTVVALVSGDTQGVYQYDGENWVELGTGGGGSETVVELTQAEYDALTAYSQDTTYIITDASAITMDDYATTAMTTSISGAVDTLSGVTTNKADKASVSANNSNYYFPAWNSQGIITGTTGNRAYTQNLNINGTTKTMVQTSNSSFGTIYAPTAAGTQNTILQSNGSGAPVWSSYKFVFISQTDYDALTTKDSTTIYFIIGE